MACDGERRIVAERLRSIVRTDGEDGGLVYSGDLARAIGLDWANDDELFAGCVDRLADLVDRPTCRMAVLDGAARCCQVYECSACKDTFSSSMFDVKEFRYCPTCGAAVVGAPHGPGRVGP